MHGIIVIAGNDGAGKSTLCRIGHPDYILIERSSDSIYADLAKQVDRLTLLHQFEDAYKSHVLVDQVDGLAVYYVVLDPSVSTLERRLQERSYRDKWETRKSLQYFKKRFQSVATDFGLPRFDNSNETPEDTIARIINGIANYRQYRQLALLSLTREQMIRNDLENFLFSHLTGEMERIVDPFIHIEGMADDVELTRKLSIKQLVNDPSRYRIENQHLYVDDRAPIPIPEDIILMRTVTEGESKRIYKVVDSTLLGSEYCIILLKSTIYSHSRQSTGEIGGLANVRATGTQLMLEMLTRNNLAHSYLSINGEGVIISEWLDDIVPLEIVVKKYCLGTDKHSYYGLATNPEIVDSNLQYVAGQYVRFDWRNPNHLVTMGSQKINPVESPYYYTIESHYGKEAFFERFLRQPHVMPLGDKQISEDVIRQSTDPNQLKKLVLRTFMTIQAYLHAIGLEVQDACFMADRQGRILWSEINQDCMRIVTLGQTDNRYDKDIWRAGGSSSKELLLQKWISFNDILMTSMNSHRFDPADYYSYVYHRWLPSATTSGGTGNIPVSSSYHASMSLMQVNDPAYIDLYHEIYLEDFQSLHGIAAHRDIIVTMDLYDGQPVLVRNGIVNQNHSTSVEAALEKIKIFPNILMVDLNRAIPGSAPAINREIIKQVGLSHYIYTGGGIKTLEDVQELLGSSVRRIVIGSNYEEAFLRSIPSNRVIVELTINERNEVLTHGRTVNTGIQLRDQIFRLLEYGINTFSLTCHHTEGLLRGIPRTQIANLLVDLPWARINKLIIAGGIASMADLEFLWSFPKVVPQVGSLVWRNVLSVGEIYSGLLAHTREIPTVIQNKTGTISRIVKLDHPTLIAAVNSCTYAGYPISKLEIKDNSAIMVVDQVDAQFAGQSIVKTNLLAMVDHLKQQDAHPEFALAKILEEFHKLLCSNEADVVSKSSDLLVQLLLYLNGKGVRFEEILNHLNAQRWNPGLNMVCQVEPSISPLRIGITGAKYCPKTDQFIRDHLGINITRPQGRGLKIDYQIIDPAKYERYFDAPITFIPCRPKDMAAMMAKGEIQMVISYSTVLENQPHLWGEILVVPDPSIKLCLIRRQGQVIDPEREIYVACEHLRSCTRHFMKRGLKKVVLHPVTGQSESFMVNSGTYHLCDAIVESGSTLIDNHLEIHDIIHDNGEIQIGLYKALPG